MNVTSYCRNFQDKHCVPPYLIIITLESLSALRVFVLIVCNVGWVNNCKERFPMKLAWLKREENKHPHIWLFDGRNMTWGERDREGKIEEEREEEKKEKGEGRQGDKNREKDREGEGDYLIESIKDKYTSFRRLFFRLILCRCTCVRTLVL